MNSFFHQHKKRMASHAILPYVILVLVSFISMSVGYAQVDLGGLQIDFIDSSGTAAAGDPAEESLTTPLRVLLLITLLSLVPAFLVVVTSFTRIIIVLSMLRHAFGMPSTPPNSVLISLALFLTLFSMWPVWEQLEADALTPYIAGNISDSEAADKAITPVRNFMIAQTNEADLELILDLANQTVPDSAEEVETLHLVPAFMLSELRTAFEIGFVVFLPFLLVDLLVASVLMSLGMIMVPPLTISLPIKVLMFVLIDGWSLLADALVRSFL